MLSWEKKEVGVQNEETRKRKDGRESRWLGGELSLIKYFTLRM